MSDNIFYKSLAALSTFGIVVIAGIQLATSINKGNNIETSTERIWLLMSASTRPSAAMEKIEMANMEQCREQGELFKEARFKEFLKYVCLKGK
tara:strand:+ start:244 stop:522 length:279 start_codon:yes stop_codon:yes gene_type:complete